ncbi:probable beta-glucosidase [Melanopsichium pennsylvanicum]|uniref:Probable beta-glucosidase G n=2 Tax=Melanopsichium pennsylvanicum TaxID=63383 RepID=A0AAJ5C6C4_9BASI|nr:probable beta-glucosidase [Melanopsichium pennsylvanicum 4]SNX85695.1 probable beta-glucosidase [Melanopsichium pennsylvanicum]
MRGIYSINSTIFAAVLALVATLGASTAAPSALYYGSNDIFARENGAHSYTGPYTSGGAAWANGFAKAKTLLDQMTVEEKINITTGYTGKCVGFTGEAPRVGLNALCLQDGPAGVRPARRVSQFPAGVTTAATWDRDLIAQRAGAIAEEFRDKGVNIWLGPVTGGPLGRAPRGGRNWEGWSPDEYLSGEASYLTVKHAQDKGVVTCAKHYIAYEQETFRNPYNSSEPYAIFPPLKQDPIDSIIDDRTTHELYMWSFAEAVRAGTGAIMCSYNEVNGSHACSDSYSLNYLLKEELNFQGSVISDWGGTWSNEESALGGLDVSMPGTAYNGQFGDFYGKSLLALVQNGYVPEARLDDMVLRILAPAFELQDESYPQPSFDVRDLGLPTNNVRGNHHEIIHQIGVDSITLVKNNNADGRGLPLKSLEEIQTIGVIGQDAGDNLQGATSCGEVGSCNIDAFNGTLTMGGGSGWAFPPYVITPAAAIQEYVRAVGPDVNIHLDNWDLEGAKARANSSEAALVFANAFATEGEDRQNLTLWGNADKLIKTVAENNNNTIVILHTTGQVDVEEWINHPNVTAVVFAYLPGQEGGASLPKMLWGETNPSGKLPFTVAKQESDYPPNTVVSDPVLKPKAYFNEKLLVDYKWFDFYNITPRFAFGHGLSFTTFKYSDSVSVSSTPRKDNTTVQPTKEKLVNSNAGLYDNVLTLETEVTNSGNMTGSEVVQLYVTFPDSANSHDSPQPIKTLRGFEKLKDIKAGETRKATFELRNKDIAVWSTLEQGWKIPEGNELTFSIGSSSRVIHSKTTWTYQS